MAKVKKIEEISPCKKICKKICDIYNYKTSFAETYLNPILQLLIRVTVAYVFLASGLLKLPADFLWIGQGDWDTTLILFEYEHPVPFLSPALAAYLGTFLEVVAPIFLIIGLGARVAAFALLIMTAVIELTYIHSMQHIYWALMLAVTIIQGAGKISLDHLLKKKYFCNQ